MLSDTRRLLGPALLLATIAVVVTVAIVFVGPAVRQRQCDGAFPVWMLQEQDYDDGGCVDVLPSSEAAPDADWRLYCVGLCNPADYPANRDYSFP